MVHLTALELQVLKQVAFDQLVYADFRVFDQLVGRGWIECNKVCRNRRGTPYVCDVLTLDGEAQLVSAGVVPPPPWLRKGINVKADSGGYIHLCDYDDPERLGQVADIWEGEVTVLCAGSSTVQEFKWKR